MLAEDRAWQRRGRCGQLDRSLWEDKKTAPEAIHQCLRHCPVLAQCWAWARAQEWDSIVVAGQWWASLTSNRPCRPVDVAEQPCTPCQATGGCSECGQPIVGRPAQARTCSPECGRQRRHRRNAAYGRKHDAKRRAARAQVRADRRCAVCRAGLPDGRPRARTCGAASCVEQWRARASRSRSRAHYARKSGQELAA